MNKIIFSKKKIMLWFSHINRYLRTRAYTQEFGGRSNVPKIAVIFTDGNSNVDRELTLTEAAMAKRDGIHIISIGKNSVHHLCNPFPQCPVICHQYISTFF